MNTQSSLVCVACGKNFVPGLAPLTCPDHDPYYGYLTFVYPYKEIHGFLRHTKLSWESYVHVLPVSGLRVNFHEVPTPLLRAKKLGKKLGIDELWIKDEGKNTTGSFKDRGSIMVMNAAYELGVSQVSVVSSGNDAISTSAYAKKAGIACRCIVPKHISVGKRFLLGMYGAQLEFKEGAYETLYRDLIDHPDGSWNVTSGINPYRDEGIKIEGFEIYEQLGVPDVIVVPCGNGTHLWGLYKAFWELVQLGITDRIPQFVGVQVSGGAPLSHALQKKVDVVCLPDAPDSIAEGIIATESYSSPKAVRAIRETCGMVIEVTEEEIHRAIEEIINLEALVPEPTAASVYAGLAKLGSLKGKTVVVIQTAGGMKNLKEIMESYLSKKTIDTV